jgi:hypothetical protein
VRIAAPPRAALKSYLASGRVALRIRGSSNGWQTTGPSALERTARIHHLKTSVLGFRPASMLLAEVAESTAIAHLSDHSRRAWVP